MPDVKLDTADAAELAELLQFLSQWLDRDPGRLGASLAEFVGHPAYGLAQLRADLERFVFLLGGSDGERLFGPRLRSPASRDYAGLGWLPCRARSASSRSSVAAMFSTQILP
jgi:hypothetical protein